MKPVNKRIAPAVMANFSGQVDIRLSGHFAPPPSEAAQCSRSFTNQALTPGPIFTGAGNLPSRIRLYSVAGDAGNHSIRTPFLRTKRGLLGEEEGLLFIKLNLM